MAALWKITARRAPQWIQGEVPSITLFSGVLLGPQAAWPLPAPSPFVLHGLGSQSLWTEVQVLSNLHHCGAPDLN